jgi:hypothetical protein
MDTSEVEFLQIRAYSEHPEVKKAALLLVEAYFADATRRKDEALLLRDAKKLIASLWLHPSEMFRFTTKTQYFTEKHRKQVWLTLRVLKLFKVMRDMRQWQLFLPMRPARAMARAWRPSMHALSPSSAF